MRSSGSKNRLRVPVAAAVCLYSTLIITAVCNRLSRDTSDKGTIQRRLAPGARLTHTVVMPTVGLRSENLPRSWPRPWSYCIGPRALTNSLMLAFPSGVGRSLPQRGAWFPRRATLCLRLCSFSVHYSKQQFAIGLPVRRRSEIAPRRSVVFHFMPEAVFL